jgi:hypothetical protein
MGLEAASEATENKTQHCKDRDFNRAWREGLLGFTPLPQNTPKYSKLCFGHILRL